MQFPFVYAERIKAAQRGVFAEEEAGRRGSSAWVGHRKVIAAEVFGPSFAFQFAVSAGQASGNTINDRAENAMTETLTIYSAESPVGEKPDGWYIETLTLANVHARWSTGQGRELLTTSDVDLNRILLAAEVTAEIDIRESEAYDAEGNLNLQRDTLTFLKAEVLRLLALLAKLPSGSIKQRIVRTLVDLYIDKIRQICPGLAEADVPQAASMIAAWLPFLSRDRSAKKQVWLPDAEGELFHAAIKNIPKWQKIPTAVAQNRYAVALKALEKKYGGKVGARASRESIVFMGFEREANG